MALPVILVDSATGSDTQASGAGPATALFGATGVTSADGLTVDLSADAPDLSGVATDGSAVIFMSDTNAGSRNFGKITAVDNGAKTVAVSDAFQATNTDAWAIGGKRASIGSTTSIKLVNNNSTNGDAMPGWTIQLQSGHSETIAAALDFYRAGDATNGAIIFKGESGAATLPLITFSNNGAAIVQRGAVWVFRDFELRNTNATKTASIAINNAGRDLLMSGIKIAHSTNKFWRGVSLAATNPYPNVVLESSEIGYCASHGVLFAGNSSACVVRANYIHDNTGNGIDVPSGSDGSKLIHWNIVARNGGHGYSQADLGAGSSGCVNIYQNTFDANTGDGARIAGTGTRTLGGGIYNNGFTNNGGYGLNFSSPPTLAQFQAANTLIRNNGYYNNSSGAFNPSAANPETGAVTTDPAYVNAAAGDFSIGTNWKAKGFPLAGSLLVGTYSTTYSYVDIGAAQRQEAASGGFVGIIGG